MLTINRLSQTEAHLLIEGARRKAIEIEVPMCIAIVDESGNMISFDRMDGAKITSITIAQDKAFTAAAARKATHEYNAACVPGNLVFGIHTAIGGRLCVVGGGLPVVVDGAVVGGIGLSSGSPQQDMECAEAGIAYLEQHLSNPR
ncbi:GlcG/HbpS family heme-binding protein [Oceanisphaera pacifica]|uniref:Heme-binding protein n=1 Tax=Oceanisphaera pacifica TaxID=2818389 RepID=A0ABS3NF44_9GAMM|nr:heme-binding protein [Oceanisphaera pacifica]MBO1519201.1 heme-binding protein [Oceanisphaera pacifica]